MSEYVSILVRRARRWDQYLGKSKDVFKLKRCTKLERFVHKGVPMSLRGDVWMLISGAKAKRDKDPTLYSTLLAQRVKVNPTIEQVRLFECDLFHCHVSEIRNSEIEVLAVVLQWADGAPVLCITFALYVGSKNIFLDCQLELGAVSKEILLLSRGCVFFDS